MTKSKCKHKNISKFRTFGRGYIPWATCFNCGERIRFRDYIKGDKE